jgi:PAS domain S-box-containing protein
MCDSIHILVIEDDADTRANLRDILELDDHQVESAGSAAEAFARTDWARFAAIILDRKLPDANADELLPRVRRAAPDAAVIVVTGYADLQGAISALRQGATDYILKPIEADDLRVRLSRVAEYRRTQTALQLAERRYRLLVQNSSDIIGVMNPDGTVLYLSPAIERMLGYRPEDRIGKNLFDDPIVHPDDLDAKRRFLEEAQRQHGVPVTSEFRLRHRDGTWRFIEAVGQDLQDEPGVGAIFVTYRDVTERKRADEALRVSEERFRCLFEAGIVGVGVASSSGGWLEANDELLRILGYSREELDAGEVRWREMTPAKYASLDEQGLADAQQRGACIPYEKEYVRKDGTPVPVLIGYASLERSQDHQICFVLDLTPVKRADEAVRRERDFAESLLEGAPALVLVLDSEAHLVRFNRFAEDLSGYHAEEVLGRDFVTTLLPRRDQARVREVFRTTLNVGDTGGTANAIVTKDGREREIRWSNRVLKDDDAKIIGVLAIGQDITDLKEAQERALRSERLAAIGQMVTGLAHESRNALQRSQACLEMLALHVDDRPKAIELINRLQQAQDHLHHLYEDVRGYAAPIRLERRNCSLSEIWREAWAHLKPQRAGRLSSLREASGEPDLRCSVDPFRLGQVFHNILDNALSVCPDPVEIEVRCARAELDGIPALQVVIRDNGPGFGPGDHQRIFEPFYTTKTKGTGLGMAIARRIIEAHGGRIAAGEGAARGAEIVMTLPRGVP